MYSSFAWSDTSRASSSHPTPSTRKGSRSRDRRAQPHRNDAGLAVLRREGPLNPTVHEFENAKDCLRHLDGVGVERGLVLPNYGIPVQEHAFSPNIYLVHFGGVSCWRTHQR
jgi:hypothetical protein